MYNSIQVIGRLGQDPEVKYLENGTPVARMSVATSQKWKDKNGERQERTDWHNVSVFGKMGDACGNYLRKGSLVMVEGQQQNNKFQDNEGNTKMAPQIKANTVIFLDSKNGGNGGGDQGGGDDGIDDAPF